MDTAKVLNKKLEPLPDVTVSRVYLTRSMLPEEATTDKNGIAKFEYKMCITEDFNCWVDSPFHRQNEYIIEEDSSLTIVVDTDRMESIQPEQDNPITRP
tara:strand:+ start:274 stop:570 length:297 start_codon:yes stop_codon:yes gene_type:complete